MRPFKMLSERLEQLVKGRLWLKVFIALGIGVGIGLLLGPDLGLCEPSTAKIITAWMALPGQVFLGLIQMIVVPLVIASVVRGLASNSDMRSLKQVGLIAIIFIFFTTSLASMIGIGLGSVIQPGAYITKMSVTDSGLAKPESSGFPAMDEMPDKVVSLLPKNPMSSMVSGEMLQVIIFSSILGFALLAIPSEQAKPLFDLLGALQEVSMRIVSWAMHLAPYAVLGLITKLVANVGMNVLTGMLMYVLTVIAGLWVLTLIYLLVIKLIRYMPILEFIKHTRELLLLAFSTSSSAAVMPLSLKTTENALHVRPSIARFLIPLGATINMTGTALYQSVATVFLAQVFQVDLSFTNYVFIVTMSVAASVGSPATPGAGIVILAMVLEGVGIPAAGVALLLGVDRILDMCRTSLNVMGDIVTCCLAEHLLKRETALPDAANIAATGLIEEEENL